MKLALCQLDTPFEDKEAARRRIAGLVKALPAGAAVDWLIFPEMSLTSFSMNRRKTTLSARDLAFFRGIAKARSAFVSFGGVQGGRNRLLTVDRTGRLVSSYAKIHLFTRLEEEKSYEPGSRPAPFALDGARVFPAVCYDLRFSYLFWDAAPTTDIYVVIACWPARRAEHWATLLRARAIENQCFVVGVNRTGRDPDFEYGGLSAVYDPMGVEVRNCGAREGLYLADLDVRRVAETRERLLFLKDRRAWPTPA